MSLADRDLLEVDDDTEPLRGEPLEHLAEELDPDVWRVVDEHHLEGTYEFDDFRGAFEFTKQVAELAEEAFHHPDIHLSWGEVGIELWTHSIGGLHENDFVMAARMDRLYEGA